MLTVIKFKLINYYEQIQFIVNVIQIIFNSINTVIKFSIIIEYN